MRDSMDYLLTYLLTYQLTYLLTWLLTYSMVTYSMVTYLLHVISIHKGPWTCNNNGAFYWTRKSFLFCRLIALKNSRNALFIQVGNNCSWRLSLRDDPPLRRCGTESPFLAACVQGPRAQFRWYSVIHNSSMQAGEGNEGRGSKKRPGESIHSF